MSDRYVLISAFSEREKIIWQLSGVWINRRLIGSCSYSLVLTRGLFLRMLSPLVFTLNFCKNFPDTMQCCHADEVFMSIWHRDQFDIPPYEFLGPNLVSIWKDEFMKWALSASCFWYFHFFISEKGTHAPFFPKRLLDITSSQKILLLNQFSNNIASGHVTVNLFLNSFNDLTIHSSGLVFFFRSKLIFGNGVGYCSFWSKGVYKPPKLEHFGPRFCPQGPWMTAHMVPGDKLLDQNCQVLGV